MMSVEKLQEYLESVNQLQIAYDKVREYGELIANTGRYMNNQPYKMTVSNCEVGFPFIAHEFSLDAKNWPSAKQIAEALSDYITKRIDSRRLYDSIPLSHRNTLKEHPNI